LPVTANVLPYTLGTRASYSMLEINGRALRAGRRVERTSDDRHRQSLESDVLPSLAKLVEIPAVSPAPLDNARPCLPQSPVDAA
jgi:hypothetical protein